MLDVQSAHLRPVRLILGVLNALRSIHLDAVMSGTSKAAQQSKEAIAVHWAKASSVRQQAYLPYMHARHF